MSGLSADDFFESEIAPAEDTELFVTPIGVPTNYGVLQSTKTTKKDYRSAYIFINVTSHSQRRVLRECGRKFQILKVPATSAGSGTGMVNLDFIFGHAVGAGIQTYLATRNKAQAEFACFLAWNTDLDAINVKKGKSSAFATLAVNKFISLWEGEFADKWELASFGGRPACELTFFIDTENGYYHAGHIDAVLRNRVTGRYMVLEIKTTSARSIDEAQYGNSEQPLGYSIVLDKAVGDIGATSEFHILYLVYSSVTREYTVLSFIKNRLSRVEWLQELLLDHAAISTYRDLGFFPKNGESCWKFNGRCQYYGICDLKSMRRTDFQVLAVNEDKSNLPETVDFFFTLKDLTEAAIRESIQTNAQQNR